MLGQLLASASPCEDTVTYDQHDMSGIHVLLIEDEPLNVTLTRAMLGTLGIHHLHAFASWRELAPKLDGLPKIGLVLLDLRLPGVDGYQILEKLRVLPAFDGVPIVAMTAQVMPDDVARCEAAGFDGFLAKPLNYDRFPGNIRGLLSGQNIWDSR